jgi:hypothetical protein
LCRLTNWIRVLSAVETESVPRDHAAMQQRRARASSPNKDGISAPQLQAMEAHGLNGNSVASCPLQEILCQHPSAMDLLANRVQSRVIRKNLAFSDSEGAEEADCNSGLVEGRRLSRYELCVRCLLITNTEKSVWPPFALPRSSLGLIADMYTTVKKGA